MRFTITLAFTLLLAASASAQPSDLGDVAFQNSGAPEAQAAFLRGLALLHNFEYPFAAEAFREAEGRDAGFVMAYWGEAMSYNHPLWAQQNLDAARAVMQKLGATPAERLAKAKTDRERDYWRTAEALYGDGTKEERDFKLADAMRTLHERYPDDVDATAFYALSILGTAHHGRDYAIYMRAAALLEEVFPAHRRHPGVLHYLIHSYDDPVHAPLGLRAARLYGGVAPHAGHALHMTSHIFVAMGMWDDVLDANRRAIDVVNQQRAARGKPAGDCGHYPTWLHYALLQKNRFDDARAALDACRASAFAVPFVSGGGPDTQSGRINEYAAMRAYQLSSGGTHGDESAAVIPVGSDYATGRLLFAYGDVFAAARVNDKQALAATAANFRAKQQELVAQTANDSDPTQRLSAAVMLQEVEALQLIADGKRADAIALLEKAAAAEKVIPIDFGPPAVPKPAAELLGDQLLAAGRAAEAAAAYRAALERTPGRTLAVEGLARATAH